MGRSVLIQTSVWARKSDRLLFSSRTSGLTSHPKGGRDRIPRKFRGSAQCSRLAPAEQTGGLWPRRDPRSRRGHTCDVATTTRARSRSGPLMRFPYDAPLRKSSPGGCCGHTLWRTVPDLQRSRRPFRHRDSGRPTRHNCSRLVADVRVSKPRQTAKRRAAASGSGCQRAPWIAGGDGLRPRCIHSSSTGTCVMLWALACQ